MDAIEMLTNDHNKVRELFKEYNGGGGLTGMIRRTAGMVEPKERRRALPQICQELETHTRIEEEVFYPAVRALGDDELNDMVKEAMSEHAKVKEEVRRLRGKKGDEGGVDGQVAQLEQDVEHHASEEENEMFPKLEDMMSAAERTELAKRMQALKRGSAARARGGKVAARSLGKASPRRTGKATAPSRSRKQSAGAGRRTAAAKKQASARKRGKAKTTAAKRAKTGARKKASGRRR